MKTLLIGWSIDARLILASYLAAWWFWMGIALGGLANVWLHNLTGGKWGEPIRGPLLAVSRVIPWLCLLFLPVLVGAHLLYPWTSGEGMAKLTDDLTAPGFKTFWLSLPFFIVRSIAYLVVWSLLAWASQHPSRVRSAAWSSFALLVYGFSVSLASVDWIMSLLPQWYSSVFGWLVGVGQMTAGMCLAILLVPKLDAKSEAALLLDLGNLLLMYVMTRMYLAFVQFLIIWAENLPHEIAWYEQRRSLDWLIVSWLMVLTMFILPMLILLQREAKRHAVVMKATAVMVLFGQGVNCWWLVFPSLDMQNSYWIFLGPAPMFLFSVLAYRMLRRRMVRAHAGVTHG